jgi:hypothetical protein
MGHFSPPQPTLRAGGARVALNRNTRQLKAAEVRRLLPVAMREVTTLFHKRESQPSWFRDAELPHRNG